MFIRRSAGGTPGLTVSRVCRARSRTIGSEGDLPTPTSVRPLQLGGDSPSSAFAFWMSVPSREGIGVDLLDRVVALVLVRLRRHRQPRVLGQQRDDRFHISALECVCEPRDELVFLG